MNRLPCHQPYNTMVFFSATNDISWCCKMQPTTIDPTTDDWFYNNRYLNSVRSTLQAGHFPDACHRCAIAEKNNQKSWRHLEGQVPQKYADGYSQERKSVFQRIEFYFDNTCDCACLYCGAGLSSKWQQEYKNVDEQIFKEIAPFFKVDELYKTEEKNIIKLLDYLVYLGKELPKHETMVDFAFLGGEPFLSPQIKNGEFQKFVEAFYTHAPADFRMVLSFVTNCNNPDKVWERNWKTLETLRNKYNIGLNIALSLESIGKVTEYVRYGSDWNTVDKNIDKWLSKDWTQVHFNNAYNAFAIETLPEFVEYMVNKGKQHNRQIEVSPNVVYDPIELSPMVLPKTFDKYFDKAIDLVYQNKQHFVDSNYNGYSALIKTFQELKDKLGTHTDKKDKMNTFVQYSKKYRNLELNTVAPKVAKYLNE